MYSGKAIYNPSGLAQQYSYWACNFYVGCSGECSYCYLKKGITAKILGGNKPELKKCFKNEKDALQTFEKELLLNLEELQKNGLFFSFTTDPMLRETYHTTMWAIFICLKNHVPVKILTKQTWWIKDKIDIPFKGIAIGFSISGGQDGLGCASPIDRLDSMQYLHEMGLKTFLSIEPVLNVTTIKMYLGKYYPFVDLIKIGFESGKKIDIDVAMDFYIWLKDLVQNIDTPLKIYLKDEFVEALNIPREDMIPQFVTRDYNMFV